MNFLKRTLNDKRNCDAVTLYDHAMQEGMYNNRTRLSSIFHGVDISIIYLPHTKLNQYNHNFNGIYKYVVGAYQCDAYIL